MSSIACATWSVMKRSSRVWRTRIWDFARSSSAAGKPARSMESTV